jgi:hypothetical protein
MEVPLLGQNQSNGHQSPAREARTAFLVYIQNDGQVMLTTDISTPLITERQPAPDEVLGALAAVNANLNAQQAAAHTMNAMQMVTNQMMQAKQAQDIASKLDLKR